jgi:hypothetical protein
MAKVSRPRPPRQHSFAWQVTIDGIGYQVTRLETDPDVATRAFRLQKALDKGGEVYDVRLDPRGFVVCDCLGNERHGHCKHVTALAQFGLLAGAPKATTAKPGPFDDDPEIVKIRDNPEEAFDYADWRQDVEHDQAFRTLLDWVRASLPATALPCCCTDASCQRCQVERIAAEA